MPDKEAFAIVESVAKLDYLLLRPEGFSLFTDHKNLTYIYNPAPVNPRVFKHVKNKVERWDLRLSGFHYEVVHISGEDNVWAHLLSRWSSRNQPKPMHVKIQALFQAPRALVYDEDFKWPPVADFKKAQDAALGGEADTFPTTRNANGLLHTLPGVIWIPFGETNLQLRVWVTENTGRGGHRGAATTYSNIRKHFRWKNMKTDIKTFINSCLHCVSTTDGFRVPRPMAQTLHSDGPNELIHFDFLYMEETSDDLAYVLIIKDDASSFVWLEP